jgi:hypothetical protein
MPRPVRSAIMHKTTFEVWSRVASTAAKTTDGKYARVATTDHLNPRELML